MKKRIIIYCVFLIALIFILGCSQKSQVKEVVAKDTTDATKPTEDVKEIFVTAKQFEFTPNPIKVKKGDKVILHVKSIDVTHGFQIPEYDINKPIKPGETVDIEFIADKPGTFTVYCSIFCGEGHPRMRGQLIVE